MRLLIKWLITAGALLLSAYLIPGITVSNFYTALILAALLGIINLTIKPILLVLTIPINILTLGLFTFIINGFLFWFLSTFVSGFAVSGFWIAVLGAAVVSFFSWFGNQLFSRGPNRNN